MAKISHCPDCFLSCRNALGSLDYALAESQPFNSSAICRREKQKWINFSVNEKLIIFAIYSFNTCSMTNYLYSSITKYKHPKYINKTHTVPYTHSSVRCSYHRQETDGEDAWGLTHLLHLQRVFSSYLIRYSQQSINNVP